MCSHGIWKLTGFPIRPKKNCYVALSRPTVKCEKNRVVFFFFFFFLCQIWAKNLLKFVFNGLKKHLHDLYMRFDCIPPEFSPIRNFKKILENSTLSRYVKKKKKKSRPTDPIFKFWSGEGNITIFFFWPYKDDPALSNKCTILVLCECKILSSKAPNHVFKSLVESQKGINAVQRC